MPIDIDTDNLKHGILGLVIALVEIIKDALNLQAIKRMEGGTLSEEELERLGEA
ncbi:gas vesicle protein K, partial [Candidatus Atribacteria bacterium HGW-Atribacteria-1]